MYARNRQLPLCTYSARRYEPAKTERRGPVTKMTYICLAGNTKAGLCGSDVHLHSLEGTYVLLSFKILFKEKVHCYPVSSQPVLNLTLALSWV